METEEMLEIFAMANEVVNTLIRINDKVLFLSILCLAIDEWAFFNNGNPIELAELIADKVEEVNHTFGKFGKDI